MTGTLPGQQMPRSEVTRESAVLAVKLNFLFGVQQLPVADVHPNVPGHF